MTDAEKAQMKGMQKNVDLKIKTSLPVEPMIGSNKSHNSQNLMIITDSGNQLPPVSYN